MPTTIINNPFYSDEWISLFEAYDDAVMAASPEGYWPIWSDPVGSSVAEAMVGTDGSYINNPNTNATVGGISHVVETVASSSQEVRFPFSASNVVRELIVPHYRASIPSPTDPAFADNSTFDVGGVGTSLGGRPSNGTTTGWWGRARGRDMTANSINATAGWHLHAFYVRTTTGNSEYRIDNSLGQSNGSSNLDSWNSPFHLGRRGNTSSYQSCAGFGIAIYSAKLTTGQRDDIYNAYLDILAGP